MFIDALQNAGLARPSIMVRIGILGSHLVAVLAVWLWFAAPLPVAAMGLLPSVASRPPAGLAVSTSTFIDVQVFSSEWMTSNTVSLCGVPVDWRVGQSPASTALVLALALADVAVAQPVNVADIETSRFVFVAVTASPLQLVVQPSVLSPGLLFEVIWVYAVFAFALMVNVIASKHWPYEQTVRSLVCHKLLSVIPCENSITGWRESATPKPAALFWIKLNLFYEAFKDWFRRSAVFHNQKPAPRERYGPQWMRPLPKCEQIYLTWFGCNGAMPNHCRLAV